MRLSGIIGAALTPFDRASRLDFRALAAEVEYLVVTCGCDAVSIGAVEAAEYTMLATADRLALMKHGVELVAGRVPTIIGASDPLPKNVLTFAEFGASIGADLIQVLMPRRPWGGEPSGSELISYYEEIAERSPLPIVAYHHPGAGADPSVRTLVNLADVERVVAFKESSRDITRIAWLVNEIDLAGKARYFTTMQPLLATLLIGGSGATMPPPGTFIGGRVVSAFRQGHFEEAAAWQKFFATFPAQWASYGLAPVMKAAMQILGVDLGEPALPYRAMTPADFDALSLQLSTIPFGRPPLS